MADSGSQTAPRGYSSRDHADIAQIRIGGSFKAAGVDALARLLHQAYGFKVMQDGNEIKISE